MRGTAARRYKFRRQHPLGRFILACSEHRLAVEADGGQHAESAGDEHRTAWLEKQRWRVLRFWNNDILLNVGGVADAITRALDATGISA